MIGLNNNLSFTSKMHLEKIAAGLIVAVGLSGCDLLQIPFQRNSQDRHLELLSGSSLKSPDHEHVLSREEFYAFESRTVRNSLRDTRVQFVTLEEYDSAVAQENVPPEQRRPVMSLIFYDSGAEQERNGSRGLAALVYTWDRRYQDLKQLAVCVSTAAQPSQREVDEVCRRFSLRSIPGLIAYRMEGDQIVRFDQMNSGIGVYDASEGRGSYLKNMRLIVPVIEQIRR